MERFVMLIMEWLIIPLMEWLVQWSSEWLKEWLGPISGILSAVATFIIAFITMKSVGITRHMAESTDQYVRLTEDYVHLTADLVKSTDKPVIIVSLRPDELNFYLLMLHIENVGTGTAYNVKFSTDFCRKPDGERALSEIQVLQCGLPNFEPGLKISHFLLSVLEEENFEKQKQQPLRVDVTYQDSTDQCYNTPFDLDFGMWEGLARVGEPPIIKMAKAVEGIQTSLNNFMRGSNPPIVLTRKLSEHRLLEGEKMVLNRMRYLPKEVQWELLKELSIAVAQRERENPKKNRASFFEKRMS